MNFTGKVKFNTRIVGSLSIEEPFTLCKVHYMSIFVFCDIRRLKSYKFLQFFWIVRSEPAGLVKWKRV